MKQYSSVVHIVRGVTVPLLLIAATTWVQANSIVYSGQRIDIQYAATFNTAQKQQTRIWLQRVADAIRSVYGELPKDRFNISIEHSSSRGSPVPWGQVSRGNPDKVLLVINPEVGLQGITDDWTAFHELSHLLIPYRGYGDMWFSEGLASYYQNIIRARVGLLNEHELWQKITAGFERGRKQNRLSHINLKEISDNMGKYRNFMRVHWSGVHYWLVADVKLRQLSENKISLDSVLKQLKQCCQQQSMSAAAIAEKLDKLAGVSIFKPLFLQYRSSKTMPDYTPVLTALGVMFDGNNVRLSADVSDIDIRISIYRGDN